MKNTAPLSRGINRHPMLHAADLSEEDKEEEAVLVSTSAPNLGLGHSSDTEAELEPPSPDIKAFHGDTESHQHDQDPKSADQTGNTNPEHSGSMEQHRLSTDGASAMPIGRFPQHRSCRPPLRANSTYASRIGMHPRATVKMVSNTSATMEILMHRSPLGPVLVLHAMCTMQCQSTAFLSLSKRPLTCIIISFPF